MKRFLLLSPVLLSLIACQPTKKEQSEPTDSMNEVLVLGMIHSGHRTQEEYSIEVLTQLIRDINPDLILTEIPPDRFPTAWQEFQETDTIKEPRVVRFPEYVDVIFPLTKEMDFEIIPTAGWTKEMADKRSQQLRAISKDLRRVKDWEAYVNANKKADSLLEASGRRYDPYWINTDEYDEIAEVRLSVYNELFNDELGPGGWDNINEAHYSYIEKALDEYSNRGKLVLITYGAGHKGWFLRALKKRDDIRLVTLQELVPKK